MGTSTDQSAKAKERELMNDLLVDNTPARQNDAAFAAWAHIYDSQANPLLALEERYLTRLLPRLDGKDILDAGCGTGRWLQKFARLGSPRSLHGVDSSADMLSVARSKHVKTASLVMAQLPALPLPSDSIDLALCSFTLSYICDIDSFTQNIARVIRYGGDIFIVDMHPDTARKLNWTRGFDTNVQLSYEERSVETIIAAMAEKGFRLAGFYEPIFGQPEQVIFETCGRLPAYRQAIGKPPIYILHFRWEPSSRDQPDIVFTGAECVLGGQELVSGSVTAHKNRTHSILSNSARDQAKYCVDLSGCMLFPGLVNAHDHLEFALFPRLGNPPYRNATDWAHDIHKSFPAIIETHTRVPMEARLWWGAIRNLLSGVTAVCHHNPSHPVFDDPSFPVRVLNNFHWAHSLSFSPERVKAHTQIRSSKPFILHACEGIDTFAHSDFIQLLEMNLIDERTVLVHGLAMADLDIETLNSKGAALISCPSSNQFLFSTTPSAKQLMSVQRLSVGSDSPLTAQGDLLDEVRFCCQQVGLPSTKLFDCVTASPAEILGLGNGEGHIAPGLPADFFAVSSLPCSPSQRLSSMSWRDVELVVVGGSVRLASENMLQRLPQQLRQRLSLLEVDDIARWIDAPIASLLETASQVLGNDQVFMNGRRLSTSRRQYVA